MARQVFHYYLIVLFIFLVSEQEAFSWETYFLRNIFFKSPNRATTNVLYQPFLSYHLLCYVMCNIFSIPAPRDLIKKGNSFLNAGHFDKALEYFTLAYKNGGYDKSSKAISLSHQALALDKLGQFEQAFAKAQEALKLSPNNALALELLIKTENQLQGTKFSYDCEEGQTNFSVFP